MKSDWVQDLEVWNIFSTFYFCLTFSVAEKFSNSIFKMPMIPQTSNINNFRKTSAKLMKLDTIRKLIQYSLKNFCFRQCFPFVSLGYSSPNLGHYYHSPSGLQGAKGKIFDLYKIKTFWMAFIFFLNSFGTVKFEKFHFWGTNNCTRFKLSNLRPTFAKCVNLHTIRRVLEYPLKWLIKTMFTPTVFEIFP